MESYEVLKAAAERIGAKALAHELGVSTSLVYKWCERPRTDLADERSGARNPLDRLRAIVAATGDPALVSWLCHAASGFFVPNPEALESHLDEDHVAHTHRLVQDFSNLLRAVSESIANDGAIDAAEAERIRAEWQQLKSFAEAFVVACERGRFDRNG